MLYINELEREERSYPYPCCLQRTHTLPLFPEKNPLHVPLPWEEPSPIPCFLKRTHPLSLFPEKNPSVCTITFACPLGRHATTNRSGPFQRGNLGRRPTTSKVLSELLSAYSNFKTLLSYFFYPFGGPSKLRTISFMEVRTYFFFGLILRDIPNSITPQTLSACYRLQLNACTILYPSVLPPPHPSTSVPSPLSYPLPDRRALQQLALNVHVKHPDLT